MKKNIIILIICFVNVNIVSAQSDNLDMYSLKLYSGEIFKCSSELKPMDGFFNCNGTKYPENKVAFYRNTDGLYANAYYLRKTRRYSSFLPQKYTGKLKIYSVTITSYNNYDRKVGNFTYTETESITNDYYMYCKGIDKLKIAKYKNLKVDLKDNANSMKYVKKLRNLTMVEGGIYALSVVSIFTGIAALSKDDESTFGLVSLGLIVPSYYFARIVMPPLKNKKIKKALFLYNSTN